MANKEKQAENKEKIGIGAWLALIVLILVLSGAFRTAEGPIKVLDFTNLAGSFGQIGDTGANLIGKGGTGAKDGFMAGFNLIPAVMFFCGLLGRFLLIAHIITPSGVHFLSSVCSCGGGSWLFENILPRFSAK